MTTPDHIFAELDAGLRAEGASVSPKFFYDALGCKLFESICELAEYYPTRTEAAIVDQHGGAMARAIGAGSTLIDLGAGNCAKAAHLFPLLHPAQYVPVDISAEFLRESVERLRQRFAHIEMLPLGLDFSSDLALPATVRREQRLFFYPGSSIGNFTPDQALVLLRRLRAQCDDDGAILIGVDLVKDHATLELAYDDPLGVTAAFNLNLLRHLNRLLGADFDVRDWRHVVLFNPLDSRIEMHLEARRSVLVHWRGAQRRFAEGERIHTENSYKYRTDDALALLAQAGFGRAQVWHDPHAWFAVIHARAQ